MRRFFLFTTVLLAFSFLLAEENEKSSTQFKSFTGKISGSKVRMRAKPDLESQIVKRFNKGDLVLIVGEKDNFWVVQPPKDIKGYIFRSYLIDETVEANKVNMRLFPNTEATIVAQLQKGDKVSGEISKQDNKWFEAVLPSSTNFYIAKELIANIGEPEYFHKMEKRQNEVETLLTEAFSISQTECEKDYEEMSCNEASSKFEAVINNYSDFPSCVQKAKDGLTLLQENYLKKKIKYLEAKPDSSLTEKTETIIQLKNLDITSEEFSCPSPSEKMKEWQPVEQAHFQKWSEFHPDKTMNDYYGEQKANATTVCGKLKLCKSLKNRPGDYVLLGENEVPVAYLYSTLVDLEKYIGEEIIVYGYERPNNNFAYPAYFIFKVE